MDSSSISNDRNGLFDLTVFFWQNTSFYKQIRVDIYPALLKQYSGSIECRLPGQVLAENCSVKNVVGETATQILITTPDNYIFQELESVIVIANLNQSSAGVFLQPAPFAKRYLCHYHMWSQLCDLSDINLAANQCVPNNMYIVEYVPQQVPLTASELVPSFDIRD